MRYKVIDIDITKIQQEEFSILKEFDRICKKHNIKYHLMGGTLLGSIRHKGFIPWDDDIDVSMLRADYETFLDVCGRELNSGYFLQTNKTDKNYIMQFAKLRKNETIFLEKSMSDLDIHHGVYIDIFPLDNILPDTKKGSFQQKLLYILGRLNLTRSKSICLSADNKPSQIVRLSFYYLMKLIPKVWTDNLLEKVTTMFHNVETEYITHLTNGASKKRYYKYMMKRSDAYNLIDGEFEGEQFPIPVNYHDVLTNLFGDYMQLPPENQREPHHGVIKVSL